MAPLLVRVCQPLNLCDTDVNNYLAGELESYPQPLDDDVELSTMATIPVYVR
jgi:hypothetical protein